MPKARIGWVFGMAGFHSEARNSHPTNSCARVYLLSSTSGLLALSPGELSCQQCLCLPAQIAFTNGVTSSFSGYSANIILYQNVFQPAQLHQSDDFGRTKSVQGVDAAYLELQGALRLHIFLLFLQLELSIFLMWTLPVHFLGLSIAPHHFRAGKR